MHTCMQTEPDTHTHTHTHLIAPGSDSVDRKVQPGVCGIPSATNSSCQLLTIFNRKSGVNTPKYAITEQQRDNTVQLKEE